MPLSIPAAALSTAVGETPPSAESLYALGLYGAVAVGLVVLLLLLARYLGRRSRSPHKGEAYESGVAPTGHARLSEPVPFYLVAIFFIVFDVEAVFIVTWAVAWDRLGWAGYLQIVFFIVMLFLGLVYLWRTGGLDWGPRRQRPQRGGEA
jgi:NADH-quinone oxidoreductase subunit A